MPEKENLKADHICGIDYYLDPPDGRPDLYEEQESAYHFPCSSCRNLNGDQEYCKKCRHYVL